jgi:outer membrane protein
VNKHILWMPTLLLGAAGIVGAQAPAAPATPPVAAPNKVGVIQIQAAIVSTKDGQAAAADLETRLGPKRKELEKQQADIKELQDKLQRGGNTMSQSAKDDVQRQIDSRTKSFNRDMEDAQAEFESEQQKLVNDLGGKLMQVIDKYAQQQGFSVILDVSNPNTPVLYASNTVDITKEIIDLYDKQSATMPKTTGSAPPRSPAGLTPAKPVSATPAPTTPAPVKKQP